MISIKYETEIWKKGNSYILYTNNENLKSDVITSKLGKVTGYYYTRKGKQNAWNIEFESDKLIEIEEKVKDNNGSKKST